MGLYRDALPQLDGRLFLAGGGGEWEALRTIEGREALREHSLGLIELAGALGAGFMLDAPIFQCNGLPLARSEVKEIDRKAIAFAAELRDAAGQSVPIVINAALGPCPDWDGEWRIVGDEAERLFVSQLGWLVETGIDMIGSPAFESAARAVAFVEAVCSVGLPVAPTLAIGRDGRLADGQPLREAVEAIDAFTGAGAEWFTIRCADPADLANVLDGREGWNRRIRGLEAAPRFPDTPPTELRRAYAQLAARAPWIAIAGLSGGRNLRHAAAMARALHEVAAVPA